MGRMYRVKICGITTADDALLAAEAGADAIGLNFYEKSPRHVDAERAKEIVEQLREEYSSEQVAVFGVFVNASLEDILWTIREGDLYGVEQGFGIQLHGDEPPEFLSSLYKEGLGRTGELFQVLGHVPEVPVVQAFRSNARDLSRESAYLARCKELGCLPQAVLLDAFVTGSYGGTGQTVEWGALADRGESLCGLPLVLAGGLTPQNVDEAIEAARPAAVDVASGVESLPGKKDAAKVYAFLAAAKKAFAAR
jgi:phosphoribosylanthranilate isomerase